MVPHGHKSVDYQRLLDGGELPTPLEDKKHERLQTDVEPAPVEHAVLPLPLPALDVDEECDGDDWLKRLAAALRVRLAISTIYICRCCFMEIPWLRHDLERK